MKFCGQLEKMTTCAETPVKYQMGPESDLFDFNALVGKEVKLTFSGKIFCSNCQKKIKKSYSQGHCFPCSMKLASCDMCIMKPETCHYDQGTCREPQWGEENCLRPHVVYLANSSGIKVGITRLSQVPTRWMDQGATQALPILEVKNRLTSGLIEVAFKKHISDRTDWRKMLKSSAPEIDLHDLKRHLLEMVKEEIKHLEYKVLEGPEYKFTYPILKYPEKITSLTLDKVPSIMSTLLGIKGQYLIFEAGVLNIRSHAGYEVTIEETYATESTKNNLS